MSGFWLNTTVKLFFSKNFIWLGQFLTEKQIPGRGASICG